MGLVWADWIVGVGVENLDAVLGHQGQVLDADAGGPGR